MADQDTGRHTPDTARNRGDRRHIGLHILKCHVTGDTALGLVPVDAYIDDDLVRIRVFFGDAVQLSGSCDQDVRLSCDGGDIDCARVTIDDCGVLVHQHHGDRAADDQRAADHSGFPAFDRNAVVMQDFHSGLRGARRESGLRVREDACQ